MVMFVPEAGIVRYWRPLLLLVLSMIVALLTAYCLLNGIQTVFPHIYYVPIILAAFWYRKSGILYAASMGLFYLTCVILLSGYNPNYVVAAAARMAVFVIIAAVVAVLSMRICCQKKEIEESEKKFHAIWEHIQAGIILVDAATHEIVAANPVAERLTGYMEREMVGKTCHTFICPAEKGHCPISDLHQTVDRSKRTILTCYGEEIPVLKTVTAVMIGGRKLLIENYVPVPDTEDQRQGLNRRT